MHVINIGGEYQLAGDGVYTVVYSKSLFAKSPTGGLQELFWQGQAAASVYLVFVD